jgi:hypothetical protein
MSRSMQLNLPPTEVHSLDQSRSSAVQPMDLDRWVSLPGLALAKAGIQRKAAAADMGLDPSLLTAQLTGRKHLSWLRLGSLPPEFWHELVLLIVEFHGLTIGAASQRDIEDAAIGRCVRDAVSRCR